MLVQQIFKFVTNMIFGYQCPSCSTRAGKEHAAGCKIGAWDGGTWA